MSQADAKQNEVKKGKCCAQNGGECTGCKKECCGEGKCANKTCCKNGTCANAQTCKDGVCCQKKQCCSKEGCEKQGAQCPIKRNLPLIMMTLVLAGVAFLYYERNIKK